MKSTVARLKIMFESAEAGYVGIEEVYQNVNRDAEAQSDRTWLYVQLNAMYQYALFEKEYGRRGRFRILKGLRLTPRGVQALHGELNDRQAVSDVTIARWRADAKLLQSLYPEFEVVCDIRLRRG